MLMALSPIGTATNAQRTIPLYPTTIPNNIGTPIDKNNANSSVFHRISTPTLRIYLPEGAQSKRTAVIICAGGGYAVLKYPSQQVHIGGY
jgi:hypothetical protein